jgi:hypothetical protein
VTCSTNSSVAIAAWQTDILVRKSVLCDASAIRLMGEWCLDCPKVCSSYNLGHAIELPSEGGKTLLNRFFGTTPRERFNAVVAYVAILTVVLFVPVYLLVTSESDSDLSPSSRCPSRAEIELELLDRELAKRPLDEGVRSIISDIAREEWLLCVER